MNVQSLMTRDVATCKTIDSLNHAAQLMWEHRRGCVPVLDDSGRVVGMLTDRDVTMAAYTQGRRLDDVPVNSAMSRSVQGCAPTTSIEEAEDLMMAHGVRRLVVVDSDGRLCGLLSLDDIAKRGAAWDSKGEIDLERVALTLGEISRCNSGMDEGRLETDPPDTDLSALVLNSLAALETLRDEVRVKLNLAGKELRDRWRRLETQLRAAEIRVRSARPGGARSLADLVESARQFRSRIHDKSSSASQPR